MYQLFRSTVRGRVLSSRLGSLLLLFQRSPLVQILFPEARMLGGAGLGEITKWTIATVVGLGSYDTVAGATTISQLAPSAGSTTVPATAGSALSFVFQLLNYPDTPGSWTVTGTLPTGLTHSNAKNNTIDSISGIPTQAGSFPITIKASAGSNGTGDSFAKSFTITVTGTVTVAPTITTHPTSVTINSGGTTILTAAASGTSPTFQWYQGATGVTTTPVSGATSASFTTPGLTTTTTFWARASNSAGTANSKDATVIVRIPPSITNQPAPITVNSGQTATFTVVAAGSTPTYQWYQGTTGVTTNPVAGATLATFTTPALTASTSYWVRAINPAGNADSDTTTVTVNSPPAITTEPLSSLVSSGGSATLAVVTSGTAPALQWYLGNSGDTTQPIAGATSTTFTTSALTTTTRYWVRAMNGLGIANSQTSTVTVQLAPVFSAPPLSQSINSGATASFNFVATGNSPTFQWYLGNSGDTGQPIPNATGSSFTTPVLMITTNYWVRASSVAGNTDSATVSANVITAPLINIEPASLTINSGQSTTLSVTASGTSLTFQWYLGNSGDISQPIPTATATTLTTPALTADSSYWARASNPAGIADSVTVTISVITPPLITTHPASVVINPATTATLTVQVAGTAPVYQWYQGVAGITTTPVVGATSASFTTPALTSTTPFWVRATNPAGTADSDAVVITVRIPPAIIKQPAPVTISPGKSAKLKVSATGTSPTFQWYRGPAGITKSPVKGAKSATFITPPLKVTTSFWVRITNPAGRVNSKAVAVTVKAAAPFPAATGAAGNGALLVGQPGSFAIWQNDLFSSEQLADALISGPAADPDADGLTNIQEYLYGLSPLVSNPSPLPPPDLTAGHSLTLGFTARSARGPGYAGLARHFALEAADTPESWAVINGYDNIVGDDQQVTYTAPAILPQRFYRLHVWLEP